MSNKKALYYNMKTYYDSLGEPYHHKLPLTFHIKEGVHDKEFHRFCAVFKGEEESGIFDSVAYESMGR